MYHINVKGGWYIRIRRTLCLIIWMFCNRVLSGVEGDWIVNRARVIFLRPLILLLKVLGC